MFKIIVLANTRSEGMDLILNNLTSKRQVLKTSRYEVLTNDDRIYTVITRGQSLRGYKVDKVYVQSSYTREDLRTCLYFLTNFSKIPDKNLRVEFFN